MRDEIGPLSLRGLGRSLRWRRRRRQLQVDGEAAQRLAARLAIPSPPPARRVTESPAVEGRGLAALTLPARASGQSSGVGPMAATAVVTICTRDHLPRARVLVRSLRAHVHSQAGLWVVIVDGDDDDRSAVPGARVLLGDELGVYCRYDWLKLTPAQASNTLKPFVIEALLQSGAEQVAYLDADQLVCAPLDVLVAPLSTADIVVVPHMRAPFPHPLNTWERPRLADVLWSGVFNAGVFAVAGRPASRDFLRQWGAMLLSPGSFASDDVDGADQRTLTFVVGFMDRVHVVRAPELNVAYWNLHDRALTLHRAADGEPVWRVDGRPLCTFHFSGFDPLRSDRVSEWDSRHSRWADSAVDALAHHYARLLQAEGLSGKATEYRYGHFPSGIPIDARMRLVFRELEIALDAELDPFTPAGEAYYGRALLLPSPRGPSLLPTLLDRIWRERADLRFAMPDADLEPGPLLRWFAEGGATEAGYGELLARHRPTIPTTAALVAFAAIERDAPQLMAPLEAPCGIDRELLVSRLQSAGEKRLGEQLASLDTEIWALSHLWLLRELWRRRADLAAAFPDPLYVDRRAVVTWIEECGSRSDFVPLGAATVLERVGQGRALARIHSFLRRDAGLSRHWATALCGDNVDAMSRMLLATLNEEPEFDLEDVVAYRWTMETAPWRGLALAVELMTLYPSPDCDATTLAEQDARLAPVLGRPGMAKALRQHRETQRRRGTLPPVHAARSEHGPSVHRRRRGAAESGGAVSRAIEDGVNCFGYTESPNGLGEMSRGLVTALGSAGAAVATVPLTSQLMLERIEEATFVDRFEPQHGINVIVGYPHHETDQLASLPRAFTAGRRNVAYLAWELAEGNPRWRYAYEQYDDVWALSEFAAGSLTRCLERPVQALPCCLDTSSLPAPASQVDLGFSPAFTVLYVLDAQSSIERKNPEAAIEAFARAVRRGDRARLILRITNGHRRSHRLRVQRIAERAAATGLDIRLLVAPLCRRDVLRLLSSCDCYLSLHRAEGFGFTCAEAMAYGRPLITTNYSGVRELIDDESALLVDYRETEVVVPEGPFRRGMVWAEPDVDHAAALLRRVMDDPAFGAALGERARQSILSRLAPERIGERVRQLLDPHCAGPANAPRSLAAMRTGSAGSS